VPEIRVSQVVYQGTTTDNGQKKISSKTETLKVHSQFYGKKYLNMLVKETYHDITRNKIFSVISKR
jgi:hypothetical protein